MQTMCAIPPTTPRRREVDKGRRRKTGGGIRRRVKEADSETASEYRDKCLRAIACAVMGDQVGGRQPEGKLVV